MSSAHIYTIGHSNHTWDTFASLLRRHGIQVLVDVRTTPKSRHAPFASLDRLPGLLEAEGIQYVFLGDSLGGKPADDSCYDDKGNPDYKTMAARTVFAEGIEHLSGLAAESTVAIMCAEKDPARCHRALLIGPALEPRGVTLRHIRADGTV